MPDVQVTVDHDTFPFPVFTVTGNGFQPNEPVELEVLSKPAGGGSGGGAVLDYPRTHTDDAGTFKYGPQFAGVLFPDQSPRDITARIFHAADATATGTFSPH